MKVLGVITARGGSKGIPGKNIKLLHGKPLLAYTIEAAQKSGAFDRIILSTDDIEIANVAKKYGCEVPFMRPAPIADDKASHLSVMQHAVTWLKENEGYSPDYAMILQPTSPLRQPFHMKEAVDLIVQSGADSVLSVAEIPENFSPHKAMVLDNEGGLILFNGNPVRKRTARRQDLAKAYWSVGIMYLFKTDLLFSEEPNFYGNRVMPYVIDKKYVVDINIPEDWDAAEAAIRALEEGK
jgi:CMP-N,N'-diacetyllegionaminic acid synthase